MKHMVLAIRLTAICALITLRGSGLPPGDVYHGEYVSEDAKKGVTIAIDPCGEAHQITIQYYSLSELGKRTCPGSNGRTYRNVQVVAKSAPDDHGKTEDKDKSKSKDKDPNKDKEVGPSE